VGETSEAFAHEFKLRVIFNKSVSRTTVYPTSSATLIVWEKFGSIVSYRLVLSWSNYQSLMWAAMTQRNLSARAYHRILKLARTIADLARSEDIQSAHLAEALHVSQPSKVDVW
jgi:hypothetical protein